MPKSDRKNKSGLSIHPLFLIVGIYYACKGELLIFFLSTMVALQHELAHAFAAARLGYRLNKIVLMPFGAVVDGDLDGLNIKDEIAVALAGPLCNLCTAGVFFALWWLYPSTYPFTDAACYASLSVFLVNLIPAYPLDGGRVLKSVLISAFEKKADPSKARRKAEKICKGVSVIFSLLLVGLFFLFSTKSRINVTLLLFGAFLFAGAIRTQKTTAYVKIQFDKTRALERGIVVKRVAILSSAPLKRALAFVCEGEYLVLTVYDEQEKALGEITQNALTAALETIDIYAPIGITLQNGRENMRKTGGNDEKH